MKIIWLLGVCLLTGCATQEKLSESIQAMADDLGMGMKNIIEGAADGMKSAAGNVSSKDAKKIQPMIMPDAIGEETSPQEQNHFLQSTGELELPQLPATAVNGK